MVTYKDYHAFDLFIFSLLPTSISSTQYKDEMHTAVCIVATILPCMSVCPYNVHQSKTNGRKSIKRGCTLSWFSQTGREGSFVRWRRPTVLDVDIKYIATRRQAAHIPRPIHKSFTLLRISPTVFGLSAQSRRRVCNTVPF